MDLEEIAKLRRAKAQYRLDRSPFDTQFFHELHVIWIQVCDTIYCIDSARRVNCLRDPAPQGQYRVLH